MYFGDILIVDNKSNQSLICYKKALPTGNTVQNYFVTDLYYNLNFYF